MSYGEIMELVGFHSKDPVTKLVRKLISEGVVAKDARGKLIPQNIWSPIRVLGYVEAGWPSPAEEELIDTMTLDEYLIGNEEATFSLKVKNDSMIEAGIMPGDLVLVERGLEPKNGDVVVAAIDGGWTLKYYWKVGSRVLLVPANKKYKPIEPKEGQELIVAAVAKAVIRKY